MRWRLPVLALCLASHGAGHRRRPSGRDRLDRSEETQLAAMLPATLRAEQDPVVARSLHLPREECVAGRKEVPTVRVVEVAEFGMPHP